MKRSDIQFIIDAIEDGVPNTALKVRSALIAIADGSAQTGDVKSIDVDTSYIAVNFDVTGLGKNERLGWAICNGNNGTRNRNGRTGIQYDPVYFPTLGATGGSKDAVVVAHSHGLSSIKRHTNSSGAIGLFDQANGGTSSGIDTDIRGESAIGKNMQPYIVTLYIMKL